LSTSETQKSSTPTTTPFGTADDDSFDQEALVEDGDTLQRPVVCAVEESCSPLDAVSKRAGMSMEVETAFCRAGP